MKTYTIDKFQKEFESHLGGFGAIKLFYELLKKQGNIKTIKITSDYILSWEFKTDIELMDIGCELFKDEFLVNEDFSFTNTDVINKLGKDNVLEIRDTAGFIGYLIKEK